MYYDKSSLDELFEESLSQSIEVRPGRNLYCRTLHLKHEHEQDGDDTTATNLRRIHILFVHGSMAWSDQFEPLICSLGHTLLSRQQKDLPMLTCHLFDAFGCGKSRPKPSNFNASDVSERELANDLKAMCDRIRDTVGEGGEFFIVAHSYGTSQVVTMLGEASANIAVNGVIMIAGAVGGGSSQVAIDGGHSIFRLPVFVLNLIQSKLTNEFLSAAYFGTNMELRKYSGEKSNQNPMYIVKAFYRQTKWATKMDIIKLNVSFILKVS